MLYTRFQKRAKQIFLNYHINAIGRWCPPRQPSCSSRVQTMCFAYDYASVRLQSRHTMITTVPAYASKHYANPRLSTIVSR